MDADSGFSFASNSELVVWDELYNSIASEEAPVLARQWGQIESQLQTMSAQLVERKK